MSDIVGFIGLGNMGFPMTRVLAGTGKHLTVFDVDDDETTSEMDRKRILWAAQDITENRPPLSRWHPDFAESAKQACS